jgi:hypothetical protein
MNWIEHAMGLQQEAILTAVANFGWIVLCLVVTLLIGLGFIGLSFYFFARSRVRQRRLSATAIGTVVRLVESERTRIATNGIRKSTIEVAPTVAFVTVTGKKMRFTSSYSSSYLWIAYRKGQKVTVVYDPEQPQDALIRSSLFLDLWLAPIGLLGLGLLATAMAVLGGVLILR